MIAELTLFFLAVLFVAGVIRGERGQEDRPGESTNLTLWGGVFLLTVALFLVVAWLFDMGIGEVTPDAPESFSFPPDWAQWIVLGALIFGLLLGVGLGLLFREMGTSAVIPPAIFVACWLLFYLFTSPLMGGGFVAIAAAAAFAIEGIAMIPASLLTMLGQ